ncbi:MAG: prephenate dehydrogenase/arogenate dehydrogenase family protein [Dehalococcoidia bacterium]|nr:prephenate dehydrogenase/arogenate dehydrogenase family protein [Dehalococcoidia bacterium]
MEKKAKQITIIGLGLIGGSLGLAIKKAVPSAVVTGYSRSASTTDRALKIGAIDIGTSTPQAAAMNADIIFVCTPVRAVKDIFGAIAPVLKRNCTVTDTASTKYEVMKWGGRLLPSRVNFIGGHPMAGKEPAGIEAAEAGLFQNCVWCLTPSPKASLSSVNRLLDLLRKLGTRPLMIDPARHDRLVAGISHLPFILSSALVTTTTKSKLWDEMSRLASSGYRDATRLASGDSRIYTDICLTNRQSILDWIDDFIPELRRFRKMVAEGDSAIEQAFNEAREAREQWLKGRQQ